MKITEIIWEDGKKYKTTGSIYEVKNHDLVTNDGVKLTKIFSMQTLSQINFEEVIEPVDTFTAYNDCKQNGTRYTSYNKGYSQTLNMDRNVMGDVRINDPVFDGRPVILDVEWVKVNE